MLNPLSLTPRLTRRFSECKTPSLKNKSVAKFEFLEPQSVSKATLLRKRSVCDDNISVLSFNIENDARSGKKRRLSRMNSLANFLSPAKQIKKVGGMLTRAKSEINIPEIGTFDGTQFVSPSIRSNSLRSSLRYRDGDPLDINQKNDGGKETVGRFTRNRSGSTRKKASQESMKRGRSWIEKFSEDKRPTIASEMSYWELKRQEAIYELYKGEKYLVKDLEMVVQAYQKSLITLKILQDSEAEEIFGPIDTLLPLHRELKTKIKEVRDPDTKTIDSIGEILRDWVGSLEAIYIPYLANQAHAKEMLDSKKANCKDLQVFLDLCMQSDFSRRLDLWNFLDVPRSKLMKYPLLLKSILKQTPEGHDDKDFLPDVISKIEDVIKSVDKRTGEANCKYLLQKLQFTDERQKEPFLYKAKTILCQGELKNNRGTKLYGFLFDTGFLLTRLIEENGGGCVRYKAHKQPISAYYLQSQDIKEGEGRSGSFKSTFSFNNSGKNTFQVSSKNETECFVLSASGEHDKQEWLQRLKEVTENYETESTRSSQTPKNRNSVASECLNETSTSPKEITEVIETDVNVAPKCRATPKNSSFKRGIENCKSLLKQRSSKSLDEKTDETTECLELDTSGFTSVADTSQSKESTPKNSGFKKGFESCKSLLKQRSSKSLDDDKNSEVLDTSEIENDVSILNKSLQSSEATPKNSVFKRGVNSYKSLLKQRSSSKSLEKKNDILDTSELEGDISTSIANASLQSIEETPRHSLKKDFESCMTIPKQRGSKISATSLEAPVSHKRRRLSSSKKLLKERNTSPVSKI